MTKKIIIFSLFISFALSTPVLATISDLLVSNPTDRAVNISWITDSDTSAEVHYSPNPDLSNPLTAFDVRGETFEGCTHYMSLTGLLDETTYFFEVLSGSEIDDNGGSYYTFTTMKEPFAPPGICPVYGFAYHEDGTTPAEGSIVTLWITHGGVDSYPLSRLIDDSGSYLFTLRESRSAETNDLFPSIDVGDPIYLEAIFCDGYAASKDFAFSECVYDCGTLTLVHIPSSSTIPVTTTTLPSTTTTAIDTDTDSDGIYDIDDNCPDHPNGPNIGTCVDVIGGVIMGLGASCMSDSDCLDNDALCQMYQGDSNGNGIGDVCECYADFNCHRKVNINDFVIMKAQYFRNDCPVCQ